MARSCADTSTLPSFESATTRLGDLAGLAHPDPVAASLRLAREAIDAPGPIALVNSFASGGALFSVVLRVSQRSG